MMLARASGSAGFPATFAPPLFCLVAGLLTALTVVPPWQNPDEPQHLMTVRLVMMHGVDFVLDRDVDPASEQAIVESMARYDWWRHYGRVTPDPLPRTFADGPAQVVSQYFGPPGGGSRLYYRAVATLFDLASIDRLLSQLYVMRIVSAFAAIATLWFIWSGTRAILNDQAASVLAALAALHPQFALVSAAASPDAFVNLAGALVWRQAAVLLSSPPTLIGVTLLWAGAIAALVLRRLGAPLLGVAAVVTALVAWREIAGARAWRGTMVTAAVALAFVATLSALVASDVDRALHFIRIDPTLSFATVMSNGDRLPAFFEMLFRTFWLAAGWLRYSGPPWWQTIAIVVCMTAMLGLVLGASDNRRNALLLSVIAVMIQAGAIVAYHFGIVRSGPQGRYLFPVLPAILCLIWLGWNAIVSRTGHAQLAPVSLVIVAAFLNASAWTLVVIPAYQ